MPDHPFPLAYFIAYKAGRLKGLMLLLIILPFFMSYVLRTVSWQLILADPPWRFEVRDRATGLGRSADAHDPP